MEYIAAKKGGRVWNGAQRDTSVVFHAIKRGNWYDASLCGAKCGRTAYGWVEEESEKITCPKCLKNIESLNTPQY